MKGGSVRIVVLVSTVASIAVGAAVAEAATLQGASVVAGGVTANAAQQKLVCSVIGDPVGADAQNATRKVFGGWLPVAGQLDITYPHAIPTLNSYPNPTNASSITFAGTKVANTSLWLNGAQVVALNANTTWSYLKTLSVGTNVLTWCTKDSAGRASASVVIAVLRDSTAPTTPSVTDDGTYTTNRTQLHSTWTASDPESGIERCNMKIGTTSGGSNVLASTDIGNVAEYTKTGLNLTHGQTYYISVQAKNKAGSWGSWGVSNGIVCDVNLPVVSTLTPAQGASIYVGDALTCTTAASDADGDALTYRYLLDGVEVRAWSSSSSYAWTPQTGQLGSRVLRVEVKDTYGGTVFRENAIYVVRKPIPPPVP